MKRLTITDKKLIDALRRMAPETGALICFGCGYECRCSVHGCAVLKAAVGRLEELTAPPPNDPLTMEQLREMDGEPVWVRNHCTGDYTCRVIDSVDKHFTFFTDGITKENWSFGSYWTAYRRKPEEETW